MFYVFFLRSLFGSLSLSLSLRASFLSSLGRRFTATAAVKSFNVIITIFFLSLCFTLALFSVSVVCLPLYFCPKWFNFLLE